MTPQSLADSRNQNAEMPHKQGWIDFSQAETYRAVAISTGHLSRADRQMLTARAHDQQDNMVLQRPTGWFVKLYAPDGDITAQSNALTFQSSQLNAVLIEAAAAGFQLVEFDADAGCIDDLQVYDD